jgi:chemotaxis protein CheY-P-specific phosphatase CheC
MSGAQNSKFDKSELSAIANPKRLVEQVIEETESSESVIHSVPTEKASVAQTQLQTQAGAGIDLVTPVPETQSPTDYQQKMAIQQKVIESLTNQLNETCQQLAELESVLQDVRQNSDRQQQQLKTSEAVCQDLRARLQRQTQQTLQFKTALEKCIELPSNACSNDATGPEREICLPLVAEDAELPTSPTFEQATRALNPRPAAPALPKKFSHRVELPSFTRR